MEHLDKKYALSPGAQVRDENFGLLFYTMSGPRLYFLFSGPLLHSSFFQGKLTLRQHVGVRAMEAGDDSASTRLGGLVQGLELLREKGVIIERS